VGIADLSRLKSALIIGSTLRKDHPLIAQRLRQAVKQGAQLNLINPVDDDLLTRVTNRAIVAPTAMVSMLAQVLKAAAESQGVTIPDDVKNILNKLPGDPEVTAEVANVARAMAASLINSKPAAILLGNLAQHHPHYADIHALAQQTAQIVEAKFGVLGEAANSVGAYIARAVPDSHAGQGRDGDSSQPKLKGMNAQQMLGTGNDRVATGPCQAYILLNLEPELDSYNPQQALRALEAAELVVMLSAYKGQHALNGNYADVLLPVAPFTETSGTFINTEGRVQTFNGVMAPLGETRPAWKVLRVLGNMLELEGFDFDTPEQVRSEVLPPESDVRTWLDNNLREFIVNDTGMADVAANGAIQRIGEVPIYQADPIVRRAESLQRTRDAAAPVAWMAGALMEKLGINGGDSVILKQGEGAVQLAAARDDKLPADCVRVAAAHPLTAALGEMFGEIVIEKS
jgi:NADH-quinone oxidoreductase subunit G